MTESFKEYSKWIIKELSRWIMISMLITTILSCFFEVRFDVKNCVLIVSAQALIIVALSMFISKNYNMNICYGLLCVAVCIYSIEFAMVLCPTECILFFLIVEVVCALINIAFRTFFIAKKVDVLKKVLGVFLIFGAGYDLMLCIQEKHKEDIACYLILAIIVFIVLRIKNVEEYEEVHTDFYEKYYYDVITSRYMWDMFIFYIIVVACKALD